MTDVRVVVVDDHQIVRDGLVALLGNLDDVEVVGAASDGREALHVVADTRPDVVVMDIQMPGLDGIEATRFITGRHPGVRVVMLTMNEDDETIPPMIMMLTQQDAWSPYKLSYAASMEASVELPPLAPARRPESRADD